MCKDTTKETAKNPGDQVRQKKIVIRRNRVCFALEVRSDFGCYPASGVLRWKTAATDSDYYEAATRERWRIGRPRPTENEEPV
jgi:hypothetical protein